MVKNDDMSIVIISCDRYKDIVSEYLYYFNINWSDCKYNAYVAMEEYDLNSTIAKTIVCGKGTTWTERAIKAINSCNSQYILLSVDDLFISKKVNSLAFDKVLRFIHKERIKYYRIPVFKVGKEEKNYPGYDNVEMIRSNRRYNVSIGTAIWDKNELLKILGDGSMSAWDLENYFLKRADNAKPGYLDGYVSDKRFLLHSVHMIKSGKWIPSGVKELERLGYTVDYKQRGYISFSDRLRLSKLYSWLSRNLPKGLRSYVKKNLKRIGFSFSSE